MDSSIRGVYITAIPFFVALYQALKLINLIERNDAFSELAVKSLKSIKQCARTIIILYAIGLTLLGVLDVLHSFVAIAGAIIMFAASAVVLFAAVLQELLRNALEIKSENDLTV